MKKSVIILVVVVLVAASVFAYMNWHLSLLGNGGNLNYIGSDKDFSKVSVKFSAFSNERFVEKKQITETSGNAKLQLSAINSFSEKVTLSLNIKQESSTRTPLILDVKGLDKKAVYYKKGTGKGERKIISCNAEYVYSAITDSTDISGSCDDGTDFLARGIPTKRIGDM